MFPRRRVLGAGHVVPAARQLFAHLVVRASRGALRQSRGADVVNLNASLPAAAATHARDMAVHDRPWHFGSDGSSPLDRLVTYGYSGHFIGENVSETFEDDFRLLLEISKRF